MWLILWSVLLSVMYLLERYHWNTFDNQTAIETQPVQPDAI